MTWLTNEMTERLSANWRSEEFDAAPVVRVKHHDGTTFALLNCLHGDAPDVAYGLFTNAEVPYLGDLYRSDILNDDGFCWLVFELIDDEPAHPLSDYARASIEYGRLTEDATLLNNARQFFARQPERRDEYQFKPFSVWCCQPQETFACVSALGATVTSAIAAAIGCANETHGWLSADRGLAPFATWATHGLGKAPGSERRSPIKIPDLMTKSGPDRIVTLELKDGQIDNVTVSKGGVRVVVKDYDANASTAAMSKVVPPSNNEAAHVRREWRFPAE